MRADLSEEQWQEIEEAARRHPLAHVRVRAMAVRAVALGKSRREVAAVLPFSAYSIGQFMRGYLARGLAAFEVEEGRGRHRLADDEEVLSRLRVSPGRFGIEQARWTLAALRRACPSLASMSEPGVLKVLHRLGFRHKRGQPWIHSPDPAYEEKKTPSRGPGKRQKRTRGAS